MLRANCTRSIPKSPQLPLRTKQESGREKMDMLLSKKPFLKIVRADVENMRWGSLIRRRNPPVLHRLSVFAPCRCPSFTLYFFPYTRSIIVLARIWTDCSSLDYQRNLTLDRKGTSSICSFLKTLGGCPHKKNSPGCAHPNRSATYDIPSGVE